MKFTSAEFLLWAAGLLCHVALIFALFYRGGWRRFRFFTAWISFEILRTIALFVLYRTGLNHAYAWVYWYSQIPEFVIVLGIAWDMASEVLRPEGKWLWGVKMPFIWSVAGAIVLAVLLTVALEPRYPKTFLSWLYPTNLFSSVLIFELGVAIVLTAHRFGLAWKNRVTGLAIGWMGWSLTMFLAEAGRSYFRNPKLNTALEQVRMYAYLAAVIYWIITFWLQEPERRPMTAEMLAVLSTGLVQLPRNVERYK